MLKGARKAYSTEDATYGDEAEDRVLDYFVSCGFPVTKHPLGRFGPDLLVTTTRRELFVEVERRTLRWRPMQFQVDTGYRTINVPERRLENIDENKILFVIDRTMTAGVVIEYKALAKAKADLKVISNKKVANGERIAGVPLVDCTEVSL